MWLRGGGCDVIFNITDGGLELFFFLFWRGVLSKFCYITLVFQPPLLIIVAQSLRRNKNMAAQGETVSHYYILVIRKFFGFYVAFQT